MAEIMIAYRLIPDTLQYGQFIVDAFALDPSTKLTKAYDYAWVQNTQVYEVSMDDEVAALQKLKYSDCLAGPKREKKPPTDDYALDKVIRSRVLLDFESWNFNPIDIKKDLIEREMKLEFLKQRQILEDQQLKFDLKTISEMYKKAL